MIFITIYLKYVKKCLTYIIVYLCAIVLITCVFSLILFTSNDTNVAIVKSLQVIVGNLALTDELSSAQRIFTAVVLVLKTILEIFLIGTFFYKILSPENHIFISDIGFINPKENRLLLRFWVVRRLHRYLYDINISVSAVLINKGTENSINDILWRYEEKRSFYRGIGYISIGDNYINDINKKSSKACDSQIAFEVFIFGHDERGRYFHAMERYCLQDNKKGAFYAPIGISEDPVGTRIIESYLKEGDKLSAKLTENNFVNFNKIIICNSIKTEYMIKKYGVKKIKTLDLKRVNRISYTNKIWMINQKITKW